MWFEDSGGRHQVAIEGAHYAEREQPRRLDEAYARCRRRHRETERCDREGALPRRGHPCEVEPAVRAGIVGYAAPDVMAA